MNDRIASSKALGFGVFAIISWIFSMPSAGWVSMQAYATPAAHTILVLAMIGLLIAGLAAFLRGETWLAFFFILWCGLSWGYAGTMGGSMMPNPFDAWLWLALGLVNFYLWIAAMKGGLGGAVSFGVLLLWLSCLASGLWELFPSATVLMPISGYLGLADALVFFYVSAGAIINASAGRDMLPGLGNGGGSSAM